MDNKKVEIYPGQFLENPNLNKVGALMDMIYGNTFLMEDVYEQQKKAKKKLTFSRQERLFAYKLYQLAGDKLIGYPEDENCISPKEFILNYLLPLFE